MNSRNKDDCYRCFPRGLNGRKPIVDNDHLCDHHLRAISLDRLDKIVSLLEMIDYNTQD